ncbi:hypothetical protein CEUSTIGMA_g4527.t1 [Chlamydomonas eustigma]|uniref:Uncharacterized protein n=1 Tax=Chlamydomonas eustigma TaxID=1157962 RepID=A0A250X1Y3_9CHLO|nr:hypothetical protein CEUSTIGMA_g4527.t1 [Chlamydomonas eustigma]|eukprot:GAX77081.1 hypothetical protein CEUSTIGMA_g4527.t1 [Chlamydomonas eustigma]
MQQIIHDSSVAEKSQSCAQTIPYCELMKLMKPGPLVTSVGYEKPSNRDYRDSLAVLKMADNNEGIEATTDWLQMMKTTSCVSCVNNNRQAFHQHSLHHLHHHDRPLLPLQLQQFSTSSGSRQEMVEMVEMAPTTVPTATTASLINTTTSTTSTRTMRRASIRMSFFDDGHDDEILLAKRLRGLLYNPDYVEPQRAHQPTGINTICKSATATTATTAAATAAKNGASSPRASTLLLSSDVVEWLSYKVVRDGDSLLMDSSKRGVPGGRRAVPGAAVPSGVPGDQDVQNDGRADNFKDKDDDYADYAACLLNTLPHQSTQSSICIMAEPITATTMQQPQQHIQQMMMMSMDFLVMAQTQQDWDNYQTNHDYMYPATDTAVNAVLFKDMTEQDNTASTTAIGFRPASPPASENCEKCSCCVKAVNTVINAAATAAASGSSSSQITAKMTVAASSSAATQLPATTATIALPNITAPPDDDAVPLLVPYTPPIIASTIRTAVTADVRNDENNIVMTTAAAGVPGGCNTCCYCCRTCTTSACTGLTGCHLLPDDPIVTSQAAAAADDTDDVSNNCTAGKSLLIEHSV